MVGHKNGINRVAGAKKDYKWCLRAFNFPFGNHSKTAAASISADIKPFTKG